MPGEARVVYGACHGTEADRHADEACEGYGYAKLWEHRGPCRSEHGVRKPERYERYVYDNDEQIE